MATKTKAWYSGTGSATIQYGGQGDGQITITSDANNLFEARSMQITVGTTDGSGITRVVTINQAARVRIDISSAVVTASNQTYSGSAKTPTPTVTLNGSTIPSTGYDVSYSNNTNAGTATITVIGKGEYTGTAYGTFTIAKASRILSFADSYMVLNTSSNGTKTATPSAGSGDGAITYSISSTTYATINSSSGKVTSKTSDGSATVTAIIAEGTNYLSASASYLLYVFATTHDYNYNGSVRNVTLPPGTYQFQCWGAQGGAASSIYTGGAGGYSIGQLTIAQTLAIQVCVGGQNGYNGGGSSTGASSYYSGSEYGSSTMGTGGGASDIRLSDGSLLSRMIVAGGGSGGAYVFKQKSEEISEEVTKYCDLTADVRNINMEYKNGGLDVYAEPSNDVAVVEVTALRGKTLTFDFNGFFLNVQFYGCDPTIGFHSGETQRDYLWDYWGGDTHSGTWTYTIPSYCTHIAIYTRYTGTPISYSVHYTDIETHTETTETADYRFGYNGGGTAGDGYNNNYKGRQNAAGTGGSFGQGANQITTNYRYCSGAGGGGWYGGGGGQKSDSSMTYVHYSGGGSGFVNTAASAGNRPSGYTGLELDSGTTYAGNTSFPSTSGGTETGHSGNGYVRITRIS